VFEEMLRLANRRALGRHGSALRLCTRCGPGPLDVEAHVLVFAHDPVRDLDRMLLGQIAGGAWGAQIPSRSGIADLQGDRVCAPYAIRGKVRGVFVRSAYDGTLDSGNLKRYIKTPRAYVWCAWQDGKVLVHVRMKNTSAEHVRVNWYPRYAIRAGGVHGDGFSSLSRTASTQARFKT
jgi:hypothetical protein